MNQAQALRLDISYVGQPDMNALGAPPLSLQVSDRYLSLQSTLQELSLHDGQVETDKIGREVAGAFKANPLLPGIILNQQGRLAGMISRRRFLEFMSRPYGLELFSQRPIECLYRAAQTEMLSFPGETPIVTAARRSLDRRPELLDEPIVVEVAPQVYRLLDVHQLLLAQAQIHELATQLVTRLYNQLAITNQQLLHLASSDSLTGVANRRRFDEYFLSCWQQMQENSSGLSLILCDVDFFKKYNDSYGHQAGDDCLRQVAAAIEQTVKHPEDLVARYGGEEFAVIMPHTPLASAVHVAESIQQAVKALKIPHACSEVSEYVTVSLGVAIGFPSPAFSPSMLITAADEMLYKAKQTGRDRVSVCSF